MTGRSPRLPKSGWRERHAPACASLGVVRLDGGAAFYAHGTVVRSRALVYPDTYLGRSVSEPAFDSQVQVRYWSMCNNDGVVPYPAIGCQSDFQTRLDQSQFYTYIVSSDPPPPDWLPADATWLPWGPTNIPITLIFRSISFIPGYSPVPSAYEPVGVLCDESLFIGQGWRACFTAAGVNVATSP